MVQKMISTNQDDDDYDDENDEGDKRRINEENTLASCNARQHQFGIGAFRLKIKLGKQRTRKLVPNTEKLKWNKVNIRPTNISQ